jgi:hypothetical protein
MSDLVARYFRCHPSSLDVTGIAATPTLENIRDLVLISGLSYRHITCILSGGPWTIVSVVIYNVVLYT